MAGDAVLVTLRDAWTALQGLNVPTAVMGGIALAAWEHVRATQDVDILIAIDTAQFDELLACLAQAGFRPKRSPPVLAIGEVRIVPWLYQPPGTYLDIQLDVLLAESEYQRSAISRRVSATIPGVGIPIQVLACDDLILHKLIAGRVIDRADCIALLVANRSELDRAYLWEWASRLSLSADLEDVWATAFPGEPLDAV